ncbi:hypothetical protein OfM1_05900 [Lactovum odontotermitis]
MNHTHKLLQNSQKTVVPFIKIISLITFIFGLIDGTSLLLPSDMRNQTAYAANPAEITPDNFQTYFALSGSASYAKGTVNGTPAGILTLTQASTNQVGMAYLKTKFDMTADWQIDGYLNIGKSGGADGVGFGWAAEAPGTLGVAGSQLGIGGLARTFGWAGDTYPNFDKEKGTGTITDWDWNNNRPGTVVTGDPQRMLKTALPAVGGTKNVYSAGGWSYASVGNVGTFRYGKVAYNLNDSPQVNLNDFYDGNFYPFHFAYTASTGTITASIGPGSTDVGNSGLTPGQIINWSIPVSKLAKATGIANPKTALSFIISGSTGAQYNLQQFALTKVSFTPDPPIVPDTGTLTVKYVDTAGNSLAPTQTSSGDVGTSYSTKPLNPVPAGYSFVRVTNSDSTATVNADRTTSGQYIQSGTTVTYVYQKVAAPVTGTLTVKYVDTAGNSIAPTQTNSGNVDTTYTTRPLSSPPAGYAFVRVTSSDSSAAINSAEQTTSGKYIKSGTTVTYVYRKTYSAVNTHKTTETIHYLDAEDRTTVVAPAYEASISFVSVKDNVTGNIIATYFYNNGTAVSAAPAFTIEDTGEITSSGWKKISDSASGKPTFDAVKNPSVDKSIVQSTDDPDNGKPPDLTKTAAHVISAENQPDITINVYYAKVGDIYLLKYEAGTTDDVPNIDSDYHLTKGKPLAGAVFELRDVTDKVVNSAETNQYGQIHFSQIPYGDYTLVETKAPEGYELLKKSHFVLLTSDYGLNGVSVIYAPNSKQAELPFTGSTHTIQLLLIIASGLALAGLIIVAVKLVFVKKRETEED